MTYTPTRLITVDGLRLHESSDLSIPVSSIIGTQSFLAVMRNSTETVLDLGKILLFENDVVLNAPLSVALLGKLTDVFVAKYTISGVPLLNSNGTYNKRLKVFNPISYKKFTVQSTSISTPEIVDDVTRKGFLDDLVITGSNNFSNYLAAVNGVFHRTTVFQNKLYVLDGFRTMRISDYKDVTLVDTTSLGGHTIIPLTDDNVTQTTYNGLATIDAGVSLKNKTVFLVIDGYFYHLDTAVYHHGDDSHLHVHTNKLPLINQFRHNPRTLTRVDRYGEDASQSSRKYDDTYATLFLNNRTVPTSTFTNRNFQYSRLTHYHSFLVVVNNASIFSTQTVLLPSGTPQYYNDMSGGIISGMLSYGEGLCPSFLIKNDPFDRKSIFIQKQDYDIDLHRETYSPTFIPSLIPDEVNGANTFCRFVDYLSN